MRAAPRRRIVGSLAFAVVAGICASAVARDLTRPAHRHGGATRAPDAWASIVDAGRLTAHLAVFQAAPAPAVATVRIVAGTDRPPASPRRQLLTRMTRTASPTTRTTSRITRTMSPITRTTRTTRTRRSSTSTNRRFSGASPTTLRWMRPAPTRPRVQLWDQLHAWSWQPDVRWRNRHDGSGR